MTRDINAPCLTVLGLFEDDVGMRRMVKHKCVIRI
jgi:hypothetical protein